MASLVSFEISSDNTELKAILFMLGYQNKLPGDDCEPVYFANSTLYHASKSPVQVHRELEVMCKQLKVNLKKCVVTTWEDSSAIFGEPSDN